MHYHLSTARIIADLAPFINAQEADMLRALDALSPQERAVFVLLGHGLRTKAIAFELAISAKTVETHLARTRAKLGRESVAPDLTDLGFLARLWVRASESGKGGQELPDMTGEPPPPISVR